MATPSDFTKMVPGFDFLQGLMKNAGSALPGMNQWIAPTLDPDELDKRIEELRTVQFWLEQNARMLAATIQALEVQRMTLSTLKTMNLPVADMAEAFKIKTPPAAPAPAPAPTPAPAQEAPRRAAPKASTAPGNGGAEPQAGVVDPMQWWGALTQQFTELAAKTLKETTTDATRKMADVMAKAPAAARKTAADAAAGLGKAPKAPAKPARARRSR